MNARSGEHLRCYGVHRGLSAIEVSTDYGGLTYITDVLGIPCMVCERSVQMAHTLMSTKDCPGNILGELHQALRWEFSWRPNHAREDTY